ncbi:hypothetical protein RUM43_004746 [Polyplax serrata]|uniref:Gem-associated protein 5 n=1 Tax=Polyplax serrata TaxID=468196 RepID=A0AAN8XNN9_POLSC
MEETVFPPSPNWFLPNILASRQDGCVAYGSKNDIVILKPTSNLTLETVIISGAHESRVTSVAFSPPTSCESIQNTIASCSEDGLVKLWKIDTLAPHIGHKSHWEQKEPCGKIVCLDWCQANAQYIVSAAANNSLVQWDTLSNTTVKFSFQKLATTTIASCPHNEKLVAVGVKSGLIFIINLTGNGDIIYKLRGHDNEIQLLSWCPIAYNIFRPDEVYEEFLLASTCQSKEVFIWRAGSDGKCELKIHIPTSPISKRDGDQCRPKLGNSFSFTALLWQEAYKLYLSSNFGELLFFDIASYLSKAPKNVEVKINKQSLNFFKLGHHFHCKGLFAIACSPQAGDIILYNDAEIKSHLKLKANGKHSIKRNNDSEINCDIRWKVEKSEQPQLLWTAGQDRKLIACKVDGSKLDVVFNLHTLNGSVFCIAVSPHDPNKIAFGTGDGVIRLWNLLQTPGEVQMYWQKIKDRVMSLAWHPTREGILAYGTSEGRVGVIDTNTNKLPIVFKPSSPHTIYSLSWGLPLPDNDGSSAKKEYNLYSVGGSILSLHSLSNTGGDPINLTKLLPFQCKKHTDVAWKPDYSLMAVGCDDGTIYLVEPKEFKIVYTLLAYKKMVQSIAWHPPSTTVDIGMSPYHTYFTSGSTDNDNEIRVFNFIEAEDGAKVQQVASLKGHYGHVQSVSWSPHVGGRLASTSSDSSVQIWDVISQTPLANYKPHTTPVLSIWSPIDADAIMTGCRDGIFCVWKISSQFKISPTAISKAKKQKKGKKFQMSVAKDSSEDMTETSVIPNKQIKDDVSEEVPMAEVKTTTKSAKEIKMFSKAWKENSVNEFNSCYSLLRENTGGNFSLPFLRDDNDYMELISLEEQVHRTSNNWTEYCELFLWTGKIKDVIEDKMRTGQLNDFLVSLAPTVSPKLWQEACFSYSKSLVEKKMYRKAASYLLCCHQVYEAINLLMKEKLYLEALCLAKSRLPKSDPILEEIISDYGHWLFKNGSFLKACECFIYLNDYLKVAKICGNKSQAEYLSLAALAARKCENKELECKEATNAILKCLRSNNLELAHRICDDHSNLKHLRVLYHMYKTIQQLDVGELTLNEDILSYVKYFMDGEDVIFPEGLPLLYQRQMFYKVKQEMLVIVVQELSLAACSNDLDTVLTHVIKALSTCCRYIQNSEDEIDPLYKLCNWLSPMGLLSDSSYFTLKEELLQAKVRSLREFVGAAIVRYLNSNPVGETVVQWINVLHELHDNFLHVECFKYFKNLIEVEICEKRLMSNQNILTRCKLSNSGVCRVPQDSEPMTSERRAEESKVNGVEKSNINGLESSQSEEMNKQLISLKNGFRDSCENLQSESETDGNSEILVLEEKIVQDKDLLAALKNDIQEFESTRVSSPNPVPTFFLLKKICMTVPDVEIAQHLLKSLERKWLELN